VQQGLPGFAEDESPISVNVIWMHLNFDVEILSNRFLPTLYSNRVHCLSGNIYGLQGRDYRAKGLPRKISSYFETLASVSKHVNEH